jgi:hypothetical protein
MTQERKCRVRIFKDKARDMKPLKGAKNEEGDPKDTKKSTR